MASAFRGWMSRLGPIDILFVSADEIGNNAFFAPNAAIVPQLEAYMDTLRKLATWSGRRSRSLRPACRLAGASWWHDRLDAEIAYAMMSINAVKGVRSCRLCQRGAEGQRARRRDDAGRLSPNNAGGAGGSRPGRHRGQHGDKPTSRSACHGAPSIWRGTGDGGNPWPMTPVSAFAPRRSPRRCWRWC